MDAIGENKYAENARRQMTLGLNEQTADEKVIDVKAEVKEIASLILGANSQIKVTEVKKTDESSATRQIAGTPEIDEPNSEAAKLADLEALMAYLMLENDEQQARECQKRIENLLKGLDKNHAETLKKLTESTAKAIEAAERAKKSKILGWIITAITAIASVALTILTCGAATGFAIAACALSITATALSVGKQILDATGVTDKFIDKKAKEKVEEAQAKGEHLSLSEARQEVSNTINTIFTVAEILLTVGSIACGIGNAIRGTASQAAKKAAEKAAERAATAVGDASIKAAKEALQEACKKVAEEVAKEAAKQASSWTAKASTQLACKTVSSACQVLSLGLGTVQTVRGYTDIKIAKESADKKAELLKLQASQEDLQAKLEEEEEELKEILVRINDDISSILEIIGSGNETMKQVWQNLNRNV